MEVKGNHPTLQEACAALDLADFPPPAHTVDRGHGRIAIRTVRTTTALHDDLAWPHLGQVFRIDRQVTALDGSHPRIEVVFGLTDLSPDQATAAQLGAWVRGLGASQCSCTGNGTGCTTRTGRKSGRGMAPGSWPACGTPR